MKILFLNPPRYQERLTEHFVIRYNVSRFSRGVDIVYGVTPPTELATLAAVVARQHSVGIIDANADNFLPREVYRKILEEKPDYLVVKAGDSTLLDDLQYYYFAEGVGIKSIVWEDILAPVYGERMIVDFKIRRLLWGEPEENIYRFFNGESGVIGGGIIQDINKLPVPLMEKLPMRKYIKEGRRNWYMFLHRGCGYGKCRFCLMEPRHIKFRARNVDSIISELEELKKYNIESIYFWDPQFNPSIDRIFEVCNILKNYKFKWETWMRTDIVDEQIIAAMKSAGCFRLHYGVESGSIDVLNKLEKGTTPEKIENAFKLAGKYNIETAAYLCMGTYDESKESFEKTIKLIKHIKPTTVVPASFRPFPTTSLAKEMENDGLLKYDHYKLAVLGKCFGDYGVSKTKHLTTDEVTSYINKIHKLSTRIAIKSYLTRPSKWSGIARPFIIRTIRNLLKNRNE